MNIISESFIIPTFMSIHHSPVYGKVTISSCGDAVARGDYLENCFTVGEIKNELTSEV